MKVEIKINQNYPEPLVTITTQKVSAEISALIEQINQSSATNIIGYTQEAIKILLPADIFRIYTENGKVFAETKTARYLLKLRLYEIEQQLAHNAFIRISNYEIININKVVKFDLSISGTICVHLSNQKQCYASRRYVTKIKKALRI
ncbi:MAG: LytTR family transcriptional regulator [Erysipelotrichaceae bacterium]|nr:LytTR family transcriptional regulator [Erysipelotrichaceae bacterium]MDY5252857.1 LytTR family DNA-binding domain-containing protein [Erysipelotrichaceae bacterium]